MKFLAALALALTPVACYSTQAPAQTVEVQTVEPSYEYRAWLMDRGGNHPVYDGDTMWLEVDLGFGITYKMGSARLYGIDTPEVRGAEREEGLIVRDYVREVMARPENQRFLIRTEKDSKGKYGRYLVTIILPDGTNLNQDLVDRGYAEVNFYE